MTLMDKYFGWKDIFFDRFVHCCNEKSDQPQGSNIPLAKINFDNKTGYVEDGTINIAELLQYLWINNKVYGCEYAPIDISSVLQTLIRLTENAKHMFEDQPGIYDMIPYRGFFLRDDFSSGKDYSLDLDKIVSGMGGFCCQSFSSSGKGKGFMDSRGRLLFCFSDIVKHLKKETKGKILFLGENVRMRDEHRRVITEELGVEPVEIDSALVSAQTRHRLYWCNWPVEMPKDKHISLDDILDNDKGWKSGAIRGRYISTIVSRRIDSNGHRKDYDKNVKIIQCLEVRKDKNTTSIKKSNCLTTVMKDNVISSLPPGRYLNAFDLKDKFRYLTPVEMCRLQTLPDDYLDGIAPNTAMSLAGNGWTVDVIAHLLKRHRV